ncbi:hypothetical protein PpBr36_00732 [Pyricularia pennisetigena]|uniref:hypothetical protein n=1 Tax=Pyricularia pennisetigena TaxID=1578925 RepID=UPI001150CBD2|nr:hypothetical protein PpBr36_00732 [Pyricularia pennisetigena]TLS28981.1 hypothetical protein PpBr36_00732 [Pyricularia pennisetigena]
MSFAIAMRRVALAPSTRTVAARRFESSAASKAQSTAKDTANKAAQGLTRVASAAGPAITNAAKGASEALGKVGGRTGRLIKFVERQVPFVVYYTKVGVEVAKIVFRGQQMSPPSMQTFQSYFQNVWKQLQNPQALMRQLSSKVPNQNPVEAVKNISAAQWTAAGVLGAELIGFFTVGEIIGRMKLVGYHGEVEHHH